MSLKCTASKMRSSSNLPSRQSPYHPVGAVAEPWCCSVVLQNEDREEEKEKRGEEVRTRFIHNYVVETANATGQSALGMTLELAPD